MKSGGSDLTNRLDTAAGYVSFQATLERPALRCRHCGEDANLTVADLGMQPIANDMRQAAELDRMEPTFPLRAVLCPNCLLVQAQEVQSARQLFNSHYTYFSSYAESMLQQAKKYAHECIDRFGLDRSSRVVEIACNDGYLLRWFKEADIPVAGVEPTANTAAAARALGIPVLMDFFGETMAREMLAQGLSADLMPANNVAAHVPDINDFVGGFTLLLNPTGVATFEFHHILSLLEFHQFDAIYHEHFYYHSLRTFQRILAAKGLQVFDVQKLPAHGGSLRVFAQRMDTKHHPVEDAVNEILAEEERAGLNSPERYLKLEADIRETKRHFLSALIKIKAEGKSIVAYGAPAKGNTLLNYAGVRGDFIDYAVDRSPHKQFHYLPGSQIPVYPPDRVSDTKPDYLLILAWNLVEEIEQQMSFIREWGGQFMILIPTVRVW